MLLPSENGDGEGKTVKGGLGSAFVADGERMGGGCTEVATRQEKEGGGGPAQRQASGALADNGLAMGGAGGAVRRGT
jgi:hypothetical protein